MPAHWLLQTLADVGPDDDWLAEEEREKLASFRAAKRKDDWRLGRWTAKQAVCRFLAPADAAPHSTLADLVVDVLDNGAPCCCVGGQVMPWPISISHSHGRAVCAVAPARALIGCDLERIEPRVETFAREWFTSSERAALSRARPNDQHLLVTLFWSAKESALKALGLGLTISTEAVTVHVDGPAADRSWHPFHVDYRDRPEPLSGWWRRDGQDLLTLVTAPGLPQPVSLNPAI